MLEFEVHKIFRTRKNAIEITCQGKVEHNTITALYGRSGIGKSSVLRMIAGLEKPDKGLIRFGGNTWFSSDEKIHLPIRQRNIGFVFQDYNLFPNMTVEKNLQYASINSKIPEQIMQILRNLSLTNFLHYKPDHLSGGQRQRIAIIRALCQQTDLLLLDEPFSALDDESIAELISEITLIREQLNLSILLVSHRKDVLFEMTDSVIHMTGEGSVQGTAEALIERKFG